MGVDPRQEVPIKVKEFYWTAGLLILTRMGDIVTTYLVTPDLRNESNIAVKIFGLGWTGALLVQTLVVALVIRLNHYHIFKARRDYPAEAGYSFLDFSMLYYFGKKGGWMDFLYKTPKDMNVFCDFLGEVVPRVLIPFSCLVALSSTMLVISQGYKDLYKGIFPLLFVAAFCFSLLAGRRYFLKRYRAYENL